MTEKLLTGTLSLNTTNQFLLLNNIANNVKMLPELSENVFLQYIAYCYNTLQIKHSTIKLYLSGIRLEYLKEGTLCPLLKTDNPSYLRITALLNAVKRIQGKNKRPTSNYRRCFEADVFRTTPWIYFTLHGQLISSCLY